MTMFRVLHPSHAEIDFPDADDVNAYLDEMGFDAPYGDSVRAWMASTAPTHEIDTGARVDVWTRGAGGPLALPLPNGARCPTCGTLPASTEGSK